MEKQLYTYKDWSDGNVLLDTTPYFDLKDVQECRMEDFSKKDQELIKKEQQQFFNEMVEALLSDKIQDFLEQHEKSSRKEELIFEEKAQCNSLLFAKVPENQIIKLPVWSTTLPRDYILAMQEYVEYTIKKGRGNLNFVPAQKPNPKLTVPAQAFAQYLWHYDVWLKETFKLPVKNSPVNNGQTKYPDVFINIHAEELFVELFEFLVKEKTEIADCSFIYFSMKKDRYLVKDLKHNTFISFLNLNFNTSLSVEKLSFKNQETHIKVYSRLKSLFDADIKNFSS